MKFLRKNPFVLYCGIIGICFLYTGSAYMSEYYRLMPHYDGVMIDVITSVIFYLFQALGIGVFSFGLYKKPEIFKKRKLFVILLATGAVFMFLGQFLKDPVLLTLFSCIFQLHIGVYFGYYLAMLGQNVPVRNSGLCYGIAYAIGTVGTYLFSLVDNGNFFESRSIAVVYLALALVTALLVVCAEDLLPEGKTEDTKPETRGIGVGTELTYLIPIVTLIMLITSIGSGLYYSLPQAEDVNWNLIRTAYAIGLIAAGFIMDRSRLVGEICAIASLAYPLIALALINDGVNNTLALSMSYVCRGFISVYYIIVFTDISWRNKKLLPLAPLGLLVSRFSEALFSLILLSVNIPQVVQMILTTVSFVPLLLLFVMYQIKKNLPAPAPVTTDALVTSFASTYKLTAREAEVLECMADGLTDDEIAEKCYISRNTVRFHVSNIFKKTGLTSRTEVIRSLKRQ